jgi:predicted metal-dependent hydrolase
VEQSQVQFGRTTIQYTIRRGKREKTVAVAVDPVEGVLVRAPNGTEIRKLDQIICRKGKWILDRRRRIEDLPPPPSPREFVSGETFRYLGRQCRLKLDRFGTSTDARVRLIGGQLHVPRSLTVAERRTSLVAWYRAHAERHLPERVAVWGPRLGLEPTSVLVRDQRKRWGSADSTGKIRFNWRIIQAPMRLVDYVVAHELVHLRHAGHTREFWALLGSVMNDYEERRDALRRLGRGMSW